MLLPKRPFPPAKTLTMIVSLDGFDVVLTGVSKPTVLAMMVGVGVDAPRPGGDGVLVVTFAGTAVVVASSSDLQAQGVGIHKDEVVGVAILGLAAVKPHAKPAVKVAANMTTRPILQLWPTGTATPSRASGSIPDIPLAQLHHSVATMAKTRDTPHMSSSTRLGLFGV